MVGLARACPNYVKQIINKQVSMWHAVKTVIFSPLSSSVMQPVVPCYHGLIHPYPRAAPSRAPPPDKEGCVASTCRGEWTNGEQQLSNYQPHDPAAYNEKQLWSHCHRQQLLLVGSTKLCHPNTGPVQLRNCLLQDSRASLTHHASSGLTSYAGLTVPFDTKGTRLVG